MRIAVVQHGDYAHARRLMAEGKPEVYTGQRYTIESMDRFFAAGRDGEEIPHLIVSLDGDSPPERPGAGEYVCVRPPKAKFLPRRVALHFAAWRILRLIKRFRPTHLILRCSNLVGVDLLRWANRRRVPTAVITAMRFDPDAPASRQFCALANDDNVALVANHNRAATASMHRSGLRAEKGVPYDFPPRAEPKDYPPKTAPNGAAERTLTFAGVVSEDKGALDLLRAAERLRAGGRAVRLVVLGDGPARPTILAHPGAAAGWVDSPGRVGHADVLRRMREGDVVVVPSRHNFPEGMPFVIAEGLAVRTPLVLSDHPVFTEYFREGEGVRYFPAGDDAALAAAVARVLDDPAEYERLSRDAGAAWESFQVETRFHHLLEWLAAQWAAAR